ncbi:hypothetical protein PAMP_024915 [Pampus punctatissimus]
MHECAHSLSTSVAVKLKNNPESLSVHEEATLRSKNNNRREKFSRRLFGFCWYFPFLCPHTKAEFNSNTCEDGYNTFLAGRVTAKEACLRQKQRRGRRTQRPEQQTQARSWKKITVDSQSPFSYDTVLSSLYSLSDHHPVKLIKQVNHLDCSHIRSLVHLPHSVTVTEIK